MGVGAGWRGPGVGVVLPWSGSWRAIEGTGGQNRGGGRGRAGAGTLLNPHLLAWLFHRQCLATNLAISGGHNQKLYL